MDTSLSGWSDVEYKNPNIKNKLQELNLLHCVFHYKDLVVVVVVVVVVV